MRAAGTFGRLLAVTIFSLAAFSNRASGIGGPQYVENVHHPGDFALASQGAAAPLCVDPNDYPGVIRAVGDLQRDIERVSGRSPAILREATRLEHNTVIIGTVGKSAIIDRLVQDEKLDVVPIRGQWESFIIQTVALPGPRSGRALVVFPMTWAGGDVQEKLM